MVRNLLIETQAREPSPSQMHAQLFHQLALAGDTVEIADQQNAQQEFGINRRPPGLAVTVFQLLLHKVESDVLVDEPEQMSFGNLVFPGGSNRKALLNECGAPS